MYTFNEIEAQQGKLSIESHGESVYRDITEAVKESAHESRWFWELLQNAKDAVDDDKQVSVKLKVTSDTLEFSHDGDPFKLNEILKLIIQGTTKKDQKKTGRFGSGFISTYILSLKVNIAGVLDDGTSFNFLLDREADGPENFLEKQHKCTKDFHNSFVVPANFENQQFSTAFTYYLNEKTYAIAESAFNKLDKILPIVLAFNSKIRKVIIELNGEITIYEKGSNGAEKKDLTEISLIPIHINEESKLSILLYNASTWQSAVIIFNNEISDFDPNFPNLFFSFPLLGTEVLGLPIVINSEKLDVKQDRDAVFLGREDSDVNNANKGIVVKAVEAIPKLLQWCLNNQIKSVYNLLHFTIGAKVLWLDENWILGLKKQIIGKIEQIACISSLQSGSLLSLSQCLIPDAEDVDKRNAFWQILKYYSWDKIPLENECEKWYAIASNFIQITKPIESISKPAYLHSVEDLCKSIDQVKDVDDFVKKIRDESVFTFLNRLYHFFTEKEIAYFFRYKIVINQKDQLIKIDSTIKVDGFGDEDLKDIVEYLEEPSKKFLIHGQLHLPSNVSVPLSREDVISKISGLLTSKKDSEYVKESLLKGNCLFLKWLIGENEAELINAFSVISSGTDKTGKPVFLKNLLGSYKDKKHKIVAPKTNWSDEFPLFAQLISERDCMHSIYTSFLTDRDFEYLKNQNVIYLKPLITVKQYASRQLIGTLIKKAELLSDFPEDNFGEDNVIITYDDFVFFTSTENHILGNNETIRSSLKILNFALKEAIKKDIKYSQYNEIELRGRKIEISNSAWVARLRDNLWIKVKDNTSSLSSTGYISERPSSANLAVLFKAQPDLIPLIKDENVNELLRLWNVSTADLIRNTLLDEQVKFAWEKTFTTLLTSGLDPGLAETMLRDPSLQKHYQKQKEIEGLVRRNQGIGSALEKTFEELFKLPEFASKGLQIKREPWGMDFILSSETSDLVNENGMEEIFKLGEWFIELKATGKKYAGMTKLQAHEAVQNKCHYALVVLPLANYEINVDNVRRNARFVTNIGFLLEQKYNKAALMDVQQKELTLPDNDIEIEIGTGDMRYLVKSQVWEKGVSLQEFLQKYFS